MNWFSQRLRNQSSGILKLPGAFDALSARLIRSEGFEAIYCGGFATVASQFGLKDNGSVDVRGLASAFGRVKRATPDKPLLVDGDTGHGDVDRVRESVKLFAAENVDAIHIEDQTNPKCCGQNGDPLVEPLASAVERIVAAKQAATPFKIAIIARTDCLRSSNLNHAIDRCNAFLKAGADAVWINGLELEDCTACLVNAIDAPLFFNLGSTALNDKNQVRTLSELGFSAVIAPGHALLSAASAMQVSFRLASDQVGTNAMPVDELNRYLRDDV
ncbi:isocitrate lyase/PEP mutase family protein [uncultured Tateyamaria sp.]|uniref:isocitrate lyase/PEP mutase family protein n=1 Tax=uncultured Tateyamaria sp. TaxID=455651 RepID=UPI002635440A|nr:isocitrate lyase/PEP mutase family protein [uncultured Tateyamaria sp.]